jgi:branched-chain amino acid transport system permease protein
LVIIIRRNPLIEEISYLYIIIAILALAYPLVFSFLRGWDTILTYGIIWAIAALGFNILYGYTGLLSFGHALFLGLGGYAAGFMLKYLGVRDLELYILGGAVASLVIALAIGSVVVRYTRIFFAILMLAIAQVFWSLYYKFYWITGGSDGIKIPRPNILGIPSGSLDAITYQYIFYYYSLALLFILGYIMWRIANSPFGIALRAVKDNETRASFIGFSITKLRLYAFLLSAVYVGIAGSLLAVHSRIITPEQAFWTSSGKIVFMTILGGSGYFLGPIIGAIIYNFIESIAMKYVYWQLIMGSIIIAIIAVMPKGLISVIEKIIGYREIKIQPKQYMQKGGDRS